jgi:hypothetical protein
MKGREMTTPVPVPADLAADLGVEAASYPTIGALADLVQRLNRELNGGQSSGPHA